MSKIRVFHISSYYKLFLNLVETQIHPKLNYYESLDYISSFRVAQNDIWKYYLEKTGEFEVFQTIYNSKSLLEKWRLQRDIRSGLDEINLIKDQIDFFKPDVILDFSGGFFTKNLKKITTKKIKIISWDGYTLSNPADFQDSNFILTCVPSIKNKYSRLGINTEILPFGFDERLLNEVKMSDKKYFCTFIGSIGFDHKNRLDLITKINTNIDGFSYWIGNLKSDSNIFSKQFALFSYKLGISNALKINSLIKNNKGNIFGLDMYNILTESIVTLNDHGDSVGDYAGNMRLFEGSGLGVCLLTDYKSNLSSIYEIGKEILTYKSTEEALDILSEIKRNDKLAVNIGINCKERTLKEYSYLNRALDLGKIISGLL